MEGTTHRSELQIGEVTVSLDEAEEVLTAIRLGEVDAVVVKQGDGDQVYTFRDPSHPYRVLLEAMSEGAALVTREGLICYHNPHFAELVEASGIALTGEVLSDLVAPEDADKLVTMLVDAQDSPKRVELTLISHNGDRRPVLLSLSPAVLADIPVFCMVATDLREHNRQAELYRAARLEVEARDRLVSVAAHELRGPLSTLVLQSELLQSLGVGDFARVQKAARSIAVQSGHLAQLVTTLLDVGSVGAGRLRLDPGEVDLSEIVRVVYVRCDEAIRRSGSEVTLDLVSVVGRWDPIRIAQVVTNVLTNAIKYGRGAPIRVAVEADGAVGRLVIEDHGPGIPDADRERLFRPYERMASATSLPGLGLGLYITAEIVKAHGGSIRIDGESGTRVVVELPLDLGGQAAR